MTNPSIAIRTAVVEEIHAVTYKVWTAKLRMEQPKALQFVAGQYAILILGDKIRRSLSIASSPNNANVLEFCVDISPMGPCSQWITNAKRGDTVRFLGPFGRFVLSSESTRRRVFVATGTGIAPIRSMIYELLETVNPERRTKDCDVELYWGLRYEKDLFWHEEFMALVKQYPGFLYHASLSRADEAWSGLHGRVTDHILRDRTFIEESDFYICGGKDVTKDIARQLLESGTPADHIRTELFF